MNNLGRCKSKSCATVPQRVPLTKQYEYTEVFHTEPTRPFKSTQSVPRIEKSDALFQLPLNGPSRFQGGAAVPSGEGYHCEVPRQQSGPLSSPVSLGGCADHLAIEAHPNAVNSSLTRICGRSDGSAGRSNSAQGSHNSSSGCGGKGEVIFSPTKAEFYYPPQKVFSE